jgi:hypothetical protein
MIYEQEAEEGLGLSGGGGGGERTEAAQQATHTRAHTHAHTSPRSDISPSNCEVARVIDERGRGKIGRYHVGLRLSSNDHILRLSNIHIIIL